MPHEHQPPSRHEREPSTLTAKHLGEVALAAQHFYDGEDTYTIGKVSDSEYRFIVPTKSKSGEVERTMVGSGETVEASLSNTLENMRSLETIRTASLAHIEMTHDGAHIDFTSLDHYSPRIAPSQEPYAIPRYLQESLKTSIPIDTYNTTTEINGWQQETRAVVEDYLTKNEDGQVLIDRLGIQSLDHLSPEQAVKLSAAVVQNLSKYSYDDLSARSKTRADQSTTVELLSEGIAQRSNPAWKGNGVCRNVAANVKAVFESLKATQGDMSMLNNTYAAIDVGFDGDGYARVRSDPSKMSERLSIESGHAWNIFTTIGKDGSAVSTIIDSTWALDKDANTAFEHLDRTAARAGTRIKDAVEKSENKAIALEGFSDYVTRHIRKTNRDTNLSISTRKSTSESALDEYLGVAQGIDNLPTGDYLSSEMMSVAYRMRDKLGVVDIETLYRLNEAIEGSEDDRLQDVIEAFVDTKNSPLSDSYYADTLVFSDTKLQGKVFDALGKEKAADLAKTSGKFRSSVRKAHQDWLPAFNPSYNPEDLEEVQYLASQAG